MQEVEGLGGGGGGGGGGGRGAGSRGFDSWGGGSAGHMSKVRGTCPNDFSDPIDQDIRTQ